MNAPNPEQITAALAGVNDPEIRRPITDLGMVDDVSVADDGTVDVRILLTVSGCPMRERLVSDITAAVSAVFGVTGVRVDFGVMNEGRGSALQESLRGGQP